MSAPHNQHCRLVVWIDRPRVPFVRSVIVESAGSIELVGVAAAEQSQLASIAGDLAAPPMVDLRREVTDTVCDAVWLCADADLPAETLKSLRQSGVSVVATEAHPSTLDELDRPDSRVVPGLLDFRHGSAWTCAAEILEQFGAPATVAGVIVGTQEHGSLLARLLDAADLADWFCAPAETVSASLAGLGIGAAETVRGLDGHLSMLVRAADGRSAVFAVSSAGGGWRREVTLLGNAGRLHISDEGFEWTDPMGKLMDEHRVACATPVQLAIARIHALVGEPQRDALPTLAARLALAHTALLSCRTGHAESCHRVARVLGAG